MTTTAILRLVIVDGWLMHGGGSGWWMGGMMIWMAVFWTAVTVGVVWLVRAGAERRPRRDEGALGILNRRLAEGAITIGEYAEHKRVLTGGQVGALEREG